jgi:hypothetical protein
LISRVERFLQVSALASHWLEDCANFTPTTNTTPTIPSAIQVACQSTFINTQLTPLLISRNDKNKQLKSAKAFLFHKYVKKCPSYCNSFTIFRAKFQKFSTIAVLKLETFLKAT